MKKEITVIVKNPGRRAEPRVIPNTLQELQAIVGGHIEAVRFASDCVIICNEEGKLNGKMVNMVFGVEAIVGTIVFIGEDGEEFTDCKAKWPDILHDMDDLWLGGDA